MFAIKFLICRFDYYLMVFFVVVVFVCLLNGLVTDVKTCFVEFIVDKMTIFSDNGFFHSFGTPSFHSSPVTVSWFVRSFDRIMFINVFIICKMTISTENIIQCSAIQYQNPLEYVVHIVNIKFLAIQVMKSVTRVFDFYYYYYDEMKMKNILNFSSIDWYDGVSDLCPFIILYKVISTSVEN